MSFKNKLNQCIFTNDKIDEFKNVMNYNKFDPVYYNLAYMHKSKNILLYIILHYSYIEDYYGVYKILGIDTFEEVVEHFKDKENEEEDFYFFKKQVSKMVRKKQMDEIMELLENEVISTNNYNLFFYIKNFILNKCFKLLYSMYEFLVDGNFNEGISYLLKMCVDFNYQTLFPRFISYNSNLYVKIWIEKIDIDFNNILDYVVYRKNNELFDLIVPYKSKMNNIKYLQYYTEEHLFKFIRTFKKDKDKDKDKLDYHCYFCNENIIYNILTKYKGDINKALKFLVQELPEYTLLNKKQSSKICDYNTDNNKTIYDLYTCICLFSSDKHLHWYFINMLTLESSSFILDDYFCYIFMARDLDFIKYYIEEYDIKVKANMGNYLLDYLQEEDSILWDDIINDSIIHLIDKVSFLIEEYGFTLDINYYKSYNETNILNYFFSRLKINRSEDDDEEDIKMYEIKETDSVYLIKFMEKYDIIDTYYNYQKYKGKHQLNCHIDYYINEKCINEKCINSKPIHNNKSLCLCRVKLNIDFVDMSDEYYYHKIRDLIKYGYQNEYLWKYLLEKIDFMNISPDNLTLISDLKYLNFEDFNLFLSKITPEKYHQAFITTNLHNISLWRIDFLVLKKLIVDGLKINEKNDFFNIFKYIDEDDVIKFINIFDMLLENGYQKENAAIQINNMIDENYISDKIIEKYIDLIDIEKAKPHILKHKRYYLLNLLIARGLKIKFKDIKKYKLDIRKIHLTKLEDIIGEEQLCMICMVNVPSVIFLPCGHLISCKECSQMITDVCPCDKQPIEKIAILKGKTEEELKMCFKCKENDMCYIYDNCGHVVCKKCAFRNKCPCCFKKTAYRKIFML